MNEVEVSICMSILLQRLITSLIIGGVVKPTPPAIIAQYLFKDMSKKRRKKGHYCWVCGEHLANERFSGKGHKKHICKECFKLSKDDLDAIEKVRELVAYWEQKNLSKKNINRIKNLAEDTNTEVSELAQVMLEVACITRYRKKRIQRILSQKQELIPRLEEVGLFFDLIASEDSYHHKEKTELELIDEILFRRKYGYEDDDPMNFDYYLNLNP